MNEGPGLGLFLLMVAGGPLARPRIAAQAHQHHNAPPARLRTGPGMPNSEKGQNEWK